MRVASLYSGAGGMDLGFRQAGFDILWANDIDALACATYRKNISDHIINQDISTIELSQIPDCDVIIGGFPYQDFSIIWKRKGIEAERGNLYRYFVKLVELKKPKAFLAENVKGLLSANKGRAINQIVEDFKFCGYTIYVKLVNFADYGVPQLRERTIIIGISNDIQKEFKFPKNTYTKETYVTAKEALHTVETAIHNNGHIKMRKKTIERLKLIPPGGNFKDIPEDSDLRIKGLFSLIYRRLHPDKPATTIIASGGGGTWGYHYREPRALTNRERARLFGFPDDYIFQGNISEVRRQIGNSVPPSGIRVFAKAIKDFLEGE